MAFLNTCETTRISIHYVLSDDKEPSKVDCINILKESGAEVLLNYVPVGLENAARFYAECALKAGVGFINNTPVFIASSQEWGTRFEKEGIPIIGRVCNLQSDLSTSDEISETCPRHYCFNSFRDTCEGQACKIALLGTAVIYREVEDCPCKSCVPHEEHCRDKVVDEAMVCNNKL
jgi:hypothetical protein